VVDTASSNEAGVRAAVRVALDFYGPEDPAGLAEGVRRALAADPDLRVVLAGTPSDVAAAFDSIDVPDRVEVRTAAPIPAETPEPARAIRGLRPASVRVATGLVRDGQADAAVLLGAPSVALAATEFVLPLLPGVTRPAVAAMIRQSVLLDVSGNPDVKDGGASSLALLGLGLAATFGRREAGVAPLAASEQRGEGSVAQLTAAVLRPLAEAGFFRVEQAVDLREVVTNVSLPPVVVTDGFSGSVLRDALDVGTERCVRTPSGGGVVLGIEGVVVVGRADSARACADAIACAAEVYRGGLVDRTRRLMGDLVAWRRSYAGLNPVLP